MQNYRTSFFKRTVTPFFVLLLVILTLALSMIYVTVLERMRISAEQNGSELARKTAQQTDAYLNDMDLLSQQICRSSDILNYFYFLKSEADPSNRFDKDVLKSIDISSTLKGLLAGRISDYNITIYNEYGDLISSREYKQNRTAVSTRLAATDYNERLSRITENGGIYILPPQKNEWTRENGLFFTLMRGLKNEYSDNVCGIIEVRCNVTLLRNILGTDITGDDRVLIADKSSGSVIFPVGFDGAYDEKNGYVTADMSMAGWSIALKIPEMAAGMVSLRLISIFLLIYLVLAAFIFVISVFLGRYITRPLSELTSYVKSIESADADVNIVDNNAIDEIKELEDSFGKMLSRLNHSVIQEKKMYSLALQAQMNPHFLYNSLSVIGAAGSEAGCESVSDMCIELSDMLRYVAAYEKVTVPLKEELQHTRNYLSLMKSRYEDNFTYSIDCDEELMNMAVPKLFIQPLAENCFNHGFREKEPPWFIGIELHGDPKGWELVISDNGTGISGEEIERIRTQLENAESEMSLGNIGGLGIVNTLLRLKMTHSKRLEYEITNDNGMIIKISARDE